MVELVLGQRKLRADHDRAATGQISRVGKRWERERNFEVRASSGRFWGVWGRDRVC